MRGSLRTARAWLTGTTLAATAARLVSGKSQLVVEETFVMATSSCEGLACRKQIVGANESLGLGAHTMCSKDSTYGAPVTPPKDNLFELVFMCRTSGQSGDVGGTALVSEKACGVSSVCLDASNAPELSEITYQIAFEFSSDLQYDVIVDVKLYFNYLEVNEAFYPRGSGDSERCSLEESCHRRCEADERQFIVRLEDQVGDGWNAGGINLFDHLVLDRHEELSPTSPGALFSGDDDLTIIETRRTTFKNTMPGGRLRDLPVCLADGEYALTTAFFPRGSRGELLGRGSGLLASSPSGAGVPTESSWTFCGRTGTLADLAYFRVADGYCSPIEAFGTTPQPSITPVEGVVPTPAPTGDGDLIGDATNMDDDGDGNGGEGNNGDEDIGDENGGQSDGNAGQNGNPDADESGTGDEPMTPLAIAVVSCAAVAVAGLAAVGGTYAQNKGWFGGPGSGAAPVGAASGAAVAGENPAPNPDVDEFAP